MIDGHGETVVPVATVERYEPDASLVFVREVAANGDGLLYGLPTSAVVVVESRPSPRITRALRHCFGLYAVEKAKSNKRTETVLTFNVPTPAEAATIGWRIVRWLWSLVLLSLIVGLAI